MSHPRQPDQDGQTTVLIVGLAMALILAVAVVVDASAAYLQRQELDSIADGAALAAADQGAAGAEIYDTGVDDGRLRIDPALARAAVAAYLERTHSGHRHPGLTWALSLTPDGTGVSVTITAPLHLPLRVPGTNTHPQVRSTGTAAVITSPG